MENKDKVLRIVEELERKYNGEHDTVPGQPAVLYADRQLAEAVRFLVEVLDQQEKRIEELEKETERIELYSKLDTKKQELIKQVVEVLDQKSLFQLNSWLSMNREQGMLDIKPVWYEEVE